VTEGGSKLAKNSVMYFKDSPYLTCEFLSASCCSLHFKNFIIKAQQALLQINTLMMGCNVFIVAYSVCCLSANET